MAAAEAAAAVPGPGPGPAAPGEAKRPEPDEWCDSGLGSLGEGPVGPLPAGAGPGPGLGAVGLGEGEEEEGEGEEEAAAALPPPPVAAPALWLRRVLGFLTEDGDTALHLAVIHEHEASLDSILRHAAGTGFLDLQNDLGQTALHLAAVLGLGGFVRRLRAAGAGLCVRERGGHVPLHLACREGHGACARLLLFGDHPTPTPPPPAGGQHPPPPPPPPARRGDQTREQLESVNYDGHTPLHVAVLRRDAAMVQLLLSAGADPDRPEPSCGRSPLHLAVEAQSPEVAECLLRGGAAPGARMFGGCTPLRSARQRPDPRLPPLLRRFGARDSDSDSDGGSGSDRDSDGDGDGQDSEDEYDDIVINSGRCPD